MLLPMVLPAIAYADARHVPASISTPVDAEQLLRLIDATRWQDFAQPEWNGPETVARMLRRIVLEPDALSCETDANNEALYAFGNNHAGTYYPVLLPAMPVLQSLVRSGAPVQQRLALCVLDDLYACFHPEPGFEIAVIDGEAVQVECMFRTSVRALRPALEEIAAGGGPNARLGRELLALIATERDGP